MALVVYKMRNYKKLIFFIDTDIRMIEENYICVEEQSKSNMFSGGVTRVKKARYSIYGDR